MIRYDNLFRLLNDLGMKKTDLKKVISSQTLAKLGKNEVVTTETIDKICLLLGVQPGEIMEVYELREVEGQTVEVKTTSPFYGTSDLDDFVMNQYGETLTIHSLAELFKRFSMEVDGKEYLDIKKLREFVEKI